MQSLSPRARFEALADVLEFDESMINAIRHSINHLLQDMNELVRMVNEAMHREGAALVLGDMGEATREKMQSVLASFVMRTINCNFNDDYCNYAVEISHGDDVPPNVFSMGLSLANDYVAQTLPGKIEDTEKLAKSLCAWNRLTAILRELTRK